MTDGLIGRPSQTRTNVSETVKRSFPEARPEEEVERKRAEAQDGGDRSGVEKWKEGSKEGGKEMRK